MDLQRIVELEEQTTVDDGVYTIIDSVSATAKKFPLGGFINETRQALSDDREDISDLETDVSSLIANLPLKIVKTNYDASAAANVYDTVVTFNATANKSYIVCASAFYASGAPNGLKLLLGSNVLKTVETSNYLDVNFVYPLFVSSSATISVQDRRASAGRHSGVVIIFEL